ncbi:hypothetical protein PDESU_02232 [Pontiella desulfatans]|uniref:Uncharacterized protein n=1 Tax=Pontiella desulfatans TaxID=2750659 RepID=A0A6C2U1B5_PONDE|nr:ATPase [Pontiella desulfatans]VGO13675.1 hypothetical protein PDESU_02232 [Pontiella desulfatans]
MKSHVGMEQKVCPVCGQAFDTGAILLDKRLRNTLERKTVTGWDLCPEHAKQWEKGYIALVECDPEKSTFTDGTIKPQDAYRTGRIVHIRKAAADRIFDVEIKSPVAFVEPGVVDALEKMQEGETSGD